MGNEDSREDHQNISQQLVNDAVFALVNDLGDMHPRLLFHDYYAHRVVNLDCLDKYVKEYSDRVKKGDIESFFLLPIDFCPGCKLEEGLVLSDVNLEGYIPENTYVFYVRN